MNKLKYIIYIIIISLISFNLVFAGSISELQSFTKGNSYESSIFGGKGGSNSAELNLGGDSAAKLGMKTDCTQLQFNYDVAAYLKDIMNQIEQYIKQSKNIVLMNSILTAIAYPIALQRCIQQTGMDMAQAPILADLSSRVKEVVIGKTANAVSVDTKAAGGNPSYAGGGASVKTKELATIGTEVNAVIQTQTGKVFRQCMSNEITSIIDFINKILNWKMVFDFKYLAKLKAECKLNNEQINVDLGKALTNLYENYSETGEMCFFDGMCIDKDLKIKKKGVGADMPTNEEKRNIITEVGTNWLNSYVSSAGDPAVAIIISKYIESFENNTNQDILSTLGNIINNNVDGTFACMNRKIVTELDSTNSKEDYLDAFFDCISQNFDIDIAELTVPTLYNAEAYVTSVLTGTNLDELIQKFETNGEFRDYKIQEYYDKYILPFVANRNVLQAYQIDFFRELVSNLFYLYDSYYYMETYFKSEKIAQITKNVVRSNLVLLERTQFALQKRKITSNLLDSYYMDLVKDKRQEYGIEEIVSN